MRLEVLSHVKPHPPAHSVRAAVHSDEIKGSPHIVSSWTSGYFQVSFLLRLVIKNYLIPCIFQGIFRKVKKSDF